jgi:rhodanese-related sulfurtransferase
MPVENVPPRLLAESLQSDNPPLLIDCREIEEWNYCRINGAQHLPMSEIRLRVGHLDPTASIVVYCHHGVRSQAVAEFLVRQGFGQVANLDGGIDAWSLQVDPDTPRY